MIEIPHISDAELEVMKVLWKLGKATSAEIILELTPITDWKPKTIGTLINRLVAKGAAKAKKTETKAFIYTPAINEDSFKTHAATSLLGKLYNGSLKMMLASFIEGQKLSKDEIDSLKKLLEEEV
jgi:BlaI family penicillinase repressor